jgi:ABC-type antimicrobial peptide transport system permease subunit
MSPAAVAARARELGIRAALGADAGRVRRLVIGEGPALVAASAAVGIPAALAATRVLPALLFDLSPFDPSTYLTGLAPHRLRSGFRRNGRPAPIRWLRFAPIERSVLVDSADAPAGLRLARPCGPLLIHAGRSATGGCRA